MSAQGPAAEKILRRLKGLSQHLNEGEVPLFTLPAIWDGGQSEHSTPCEIVLTNQRVMGFYYASFPRERLFLDALALPGIQVVSLRQKSFEPLFRELLLSEGQRKVYIRAPRARISGQAFKWGACFCHHYNTLQPNLRSPGNPGHV